MRIRSHHPLVTAMLLGAVVAATADIPGRAVSPSPPARRAAASAAGVLTYRGGPQRDGNMPGPGPLGKASVAWVFQAGGPFASQPMVQEGVVYTVSNEGTLHAIDLATGTERWSAALGTNSTGSPLLLDDHVLVATDDGLALHLDGGRLAGLEDVRDAAAEGQPGVDRRPRGRGRGGRLGERGRPEPPARSSGRPASARAWTRAPPRPRTRSSWAPRPARSWRCPPADGTLRWRTDTGDGARVGTPAISDGHVYIATLDGGGPGQQPHPAAGPGHAARCCGPSPARIRCPATAPRSWTAWPSRKASRAP